MADQEKVVLLKIENNLEGTVRAMAEYQAEIERLDAEQVKLAKDLDEGRISQDEYRKAMVRAKEEKKAYGKEVRELSRKVQNSLVAENKYKDSLKGMAAELSKQKDILRSMKTTDPGWKDQRDKVAALNQEMKELEQSYGVYGRDVGHYTIVLENLRKEQKELYAQMVALKMEGKENSEEYQEAAQRAAQLADTQNDVRQQTQGLASDTSKLDAAMQGTALAMGGLTVIGAFFDDGSEAGKKFNEIMRKLTVVSIALVGITKIYNSLQKQGILMQTAMMVKEKARLALTKMQTAATGAQTVAQRILNAVMNANPVLLIVAGVTALIGAMAALVGITDDAKDSQEEENKALKQFDINMRLRAAQIQKSRLEYDLNSKSRLLAIEQEIDALRKSGATAEEIEKAKQKLAKETLKDQIKQAKIELKTAEQTYKLQQEAFEKRKKEMDSQRSSPDSMFESEIELLEKVNAAEADVQEAIKNFYDLRFALTQIDYDEQQKALKAQYDLELEVLNRREKIEQTSYKRKLKFAYDANKSELENDVEKFKMQQALELETFNLQQRNARKRLDIQLRYGKITRAAYNDEIALLDEDAKDFEQERNNALADFTRNTLQKVISMAGGKMLENQLEDIKAQYASARSQIERSVEMSEEEMAYYIHRLNDAETKAIADAKIASQKEVEERIQEMVDDRYRDDIRKFNESEAEQLALEIEKQKALIAEKRKAGLHTLAEEAELANSEAKLRQAELDKTLAMEWRNADARYLAQKAYYERELELAQDNAEKRADLEQKLTELNVAHHQQKIDTITEYAQQSLEILGSLNDVLNAFQERDLQKYEKDNEAKKKSLQKQLDAGLISQKQHDKQVAKLDADLDQKKAEIARKQAIRERILSTGQIAMNTATAIMKLWAEVPKGDYGAATIALTAMASALGAAQLAAVWAAPLPMAREGGLIQGPTHESGGVLINAEGGERIISRNPAKAFPELLNLMSYIGKHSNIPDTGYSARVFGSVNGANDIDMDALADRIGARMVEAVRGLNIAVAVEDIRKADREYTKVEQSSRM